MKQTSGGQLSRKAKATLLSSHAEGPRTAAGDTSLTGQAKAVDTAVESQPAASPRTYRSGRTSPPRQPVTLTVTAVNLGRSRETPRLSWLRAEREWGPDYGLRIGQPPSMTPALLNMAVNIPANPGP